MRVAAITAVLVVMALLSGGVVSAQEAVAPPESDEEQTHWYRKLGLTVGATGVLQGSSGVRDSLRSNGATSAGSVSFDLELSAPLAENGLFYALLQSGTGSGVDSDLPTFSGFNADADDDSSVRLAEVWYEHGGAGGRWRLRAGKIDLTTDFDTNAVANGETEQFLSGAFVNNLAVEFPDDNGAGAMLWLAPHDKWDLGLGAADADADGGNLSGNLFSMLELSCKPLLRGRPGHYRLYGWLNHKDHEDLSNPAVATASNRGWGVSCDQEIGGDVTLFARAGWQRESVAAVRSAWSLGLQYTGRLWGQEGQALGLAYGVAAPGEAWSASTGLSRPGDEHHLELYYNRRVNDHLTITPDLQWVSNPNGDRSNGRLWVLGVRTQLSF